MFVAYEPDDYLHSLIEIRKSDARRLFQSQYIALSLRGPLDKPLVPIAGNGMAR